MAATRRKRSSTDRGPRPPWLRSAILIAVAFLAAATVVIIAVAIGPPGSSGGLQASPLDTNPDLDPGTPLSGRAPAFTLTNQFGRAVSLASLRGHVVILAFNDSQCTTVCPLTTSAMVEAKSLLGAAGNDVELLGIDANPKATAVRWVRAYSQAHGMLHQWQFLTGSLPQLRRVWRAYHIYVAITAGQIDHTPAVYVINRQGQLARIYQTQMAYDSVGQQAQLLAHEAAGLLPGHPRVHSSLSYAQMASTEPAAVATLPRAGGGSVPIGPNGAPRLYFFFATWLTETMAIGAQLDALRGYQATAIARGLPRLTAVDEGSVESSSAALPRFLRALRTPLPYPVAIDRSGRVADGYLVQDQPWFVLVSRSGTILWYWDGSTQGALTAPELAEHVGAALTTPPRVKPPALRALPRLLAGSPAPLAALHRQAGELLGSGSALQARVRTLRGYPLVVNAWASWCAACRNEYPLFASASVRYGRQVAFLGVDAEDFGAGYARSYLAGHPLSYPSYQSPDGQLPGLAGLFGLPTTIYVDRQGSVVKVVPGGYDSQGELDGDIQHYLGL